MSHCRGRCTPRHPHRNQPSDGPLLGVHQERALFVDCYNNGTNYPLVFEHEAFDPSIYYVFVSLHILGRTAGGDSLQTTFPEIAAVWTALPWKPASSTALPLCP